MNYVMFSNLYEGSRIDSSSDFDPDQMVRTVRGFGEQGDWNVVEGFVFSVLADNNTYWFKQTRLRGDVFLLIREISDAPERTRVADHLLKWCERTHR